MSDDPFLDDPSLVNDDLPTDGAIRSVATLATELRAVEAEVLAATEALQATLARYRQLADVDLPVAMRSAGTAELTTDGGTKVALVTAYDGRQLTDPAGLRWIEANGGSSLIKTTVVAELDRGDVEAAREILELIRASRHANRLKTLALNESVHPQTLVAFVRRLIDERRDPPLDVLGVHRRTYATVGGRRPKSVELRGFRR